MARRWWMAAGGLLLTAGAVWFLVVQGLDDADKWRSVLGAIGASVGLAASVLGLVGGRSRPRQREQSVTGSIIDNRVQARGVDGSVRLSRRSAVVVGGDWMIKPRVHRISARTGADRPRRPVPLSPQNPGLGLDTAGQPDAVTQTGRELPTHDRDSRLRELAVTYGEPAVVQALRDTAAILAVVARTGAQAAS